MSSTFSIHPFQPHYCFSLHPSRPGLFSMDKWKKPTQKSKWHQKPTQVICSPCQSYVFPSQLREPGRATQSEDRPYYSYGSHTFHWLLDAHIFTLVLRLCSRSREAKRVHAAFLKLAEGPGIFFYNNLISTYIKFSRVDIARLLFDRMPVRDVVTWTALLTGYSKMGLENEFLDLLREMVRSSVQPNCMTIVCSLNFCSRQLNFRLGRQIHASALKRRQMNIIVDSTLLHFYAQFGDLSSMYRIFDRMQKRDIIAWTTMIAACAEHECGDDAFSLFSQMQSHGFMPNEFTVCSILKACAREKSLRFGRQLHGSIVKGLVKSDMHLGTTLVDMYVRCGEVEDARSVFNLMPIRNTTTWTSMIAGYAQNGLGAAAVGFFRRMKRLRILTNDSTFVSVLRACGSLGSLSLGKEVHGQILKNNAHANSHILNTLAWVYCQCGENAYAAKVFEAIPVRDVTSWTTMVSGHTALGNDLEALYFLNRMLEDGIEPNSFTCSSALKACSRLETLMHGRSIHSFISKSYGLEDVFVGTALIGLYMKCGCIDDARRVFNMMPKHNLVTWKAMVIGHARNGLCVEALKLMHEMQAAGYHVDNYVSSTVFSSFSGIQWDRQQFHLHGC